MTTTTRPPTERELPPHEDVGPAELMWNRDFALLWLMHAVSQTAHNAVLFSLLVIVTTDTGSSIYASLLVLSFISPAVFVGLFAGVLVDRSRKRTVLATTSAIRAAICLAFPFVTESVWAIYGLTIAFSIVAQLFNPAVVTVIPKLVPRSHLLAANGLFNVTLTGGQFAGMVVLSPLMLKAFGDEAMFGTAAVLLLGSAIVALVMPHLDEPPRDEDAATYGLRDVVADVRTSLRRLRSDQEASRAMSQLVLGSSLILLVVVLIPIYMGAVLDVGAENAAFVFAPAGLGAALGLRAIPRAATRYPHATRVAMGFGAVALAFLAISLVEPVGALLGQTTEYDPFSGDRQPGLGVMVGLTMVFSIPFGFGYAMANASAQTVLHDRAPEEMRGRYFATQIALANAISIPALLLLGAAADIVGVSPVIAILGAGILAASYVSGRPSGFSLPRGRQANPRNGRREDLPEDLPPAELDDDERSEVGSHSDLTRSR
ncbi:MAG TPA: MFS transporter [Dehalococcoidia bacterium]|nr:MFS transporter [Dehalococcoidia bacterium]